MEGPPIRFQCTGPFLVVISDWIAANNSASLLFVSSAAATRGAPDVHEVVVAAAAADVAAKSRTKVRLSFVPGGDCDGVVCKEHAILALRRRRSVRGRGLFVILPNHCQAGAGCARWMLLAGPRGFAGKQD